MVKCYKCKKELNLLHKKHKSIDGSVICDNCMGKATNPKYEEPSKKWKRWFIASGISVVFGIVVAYLLILIFGLDENAIGTATPYGIITIWILVNVVLKNIEEKKK